MSYLNLPPVSKQAEEEDEDAIRSMAANLRILTEGIRARQGKVSGYDVALIQDAMPVYINFTKVGYNVNVPAGTAISTPGKTVYRVELLNTGSGIVKYSIGLSAMEGGTKTLISGQYVKHEAERPVYESVTLRAIGANATVNVAFEI